MWVIIATACAVALGGCEGFIFKTPYASEAECETAKPAAVAEAIPIFRNAAAAVGILPTEMTLAFKCVERPAGEKTL